MRLLVKLDFAADLTLFPEYTIIMKRNNYKEPEQSFLYIPSQNLWNAVMGRGPPPSCTLSLRWLCGHIVRWLCRHIYAMAIIVDQQTPLLKILRMGLKGHQRSVLVLLTGLKQENCKIKWRTNNIVFIIIHVPAHCRSVQSVQKGNSRRRERKY